MIVKKLNDKTIDVFVGKGWNNWSRFNIEYQKGRMLLKLIKGSPMRNEDFKELFTQLST